VGLTLIIVWSGRKLQVEGDSKFKLFVLRAPKIAPHKVEREGHPYFQHLTCV